MGHWQEDAVELLLSVSPASWCQICFTLATCAVLAVAIAPKAERKLLVNYGARAHDSTATAAADAPAPEGGDDVFLRAVRRLTSFGQVPHSWFFTFYFVYIQCALFWAVQVISGGSVLQFIARQQVELGTPASVNRNQVVITWCLMLFQAARRLYESWAFAKPSKSTMWFVHWLLGQFFYLGISVAIWIEGSDVAVHNELLSTTHEFTADALFKVAVALPMFVFGWVSHA
ncbi:hypothetical protein VP1G_07063 [Cytospora mali]|uniref:Polyprenal reductase n=1 Tax=Cytospora mali TaxID=578113 RepID=A0A194V7H7_CYTMA|nr:hypothetical protein VP1G_07063 [Valsa mali var. pyri (nom. inval.)]